MAYRLLLGLVCLAALAVPAAAAPISYVAYLTGPAEEPSTASPGTGTAFVTIDDVTHLMEIAATFAGLLGTTTAAHIHVINGPGDVDTTDTVGPVATQAPSFTGFPLGVTSGTQSQTFNMLDGSSYRGGFVTAAGSIPQAEAALFAAIADGRAYFNIHTTLFMGGEIRGFLQPAPAVPEPGTLLLLGAGLGALVRTRSRRQA